MTDSPWKVLGLSPGADANAIRKAFHKQALRWHPDKCQDANATAKFIQIQGAFEKLSQVEKNTETSRTPPTASRTPSSSSADRARTHASSPRCSDCGGQNRGGRMGRGVFASVFFCSPCWKLWDLIIDAQRQLQLFKKQMQAQQREKKQQNQAQRLEKGKSKKQSPKKKKRKTNAAKIQAAKALIAQKQMQHRQAQKKMQQQMHTSKKLPKSQTKPSKAALALQKENQEWMAKWNEGKKHKLQHQKSTSSSGKFQRKTTSAAAGHFGRSSSVGPNHIQQERRVREAASNACSSGNLQQQKTTSFAAGSLSSSRNGSAGPKHMQQERSSMRTDPGTMGADPSLKRAREFQASVASMRADPSLKRAQEVQASAARMSVLLSALSKPTASELENMFRSGGDAALSRVGWQRKESRQCPGKFYFWNPASGATEFEASPPQVHQPRTPPEMLRKVLPAGWQKVESRSKPGNFYYYNASTGESQVEVPQVQLRG